MIHVVLCGYGQMGRLLQKSISRCYDMELVMIVNQYNEYELYQLKQPIDLFIDFSHPDNLNMIHRYISYSNCALLSGTTGFSKAQMKQIKGLGRSARVMHAVNFSLGTALMLRMLRQITPILCEDFDMEIVEWHHNQKQDAPSGTANMMLAAMDPYKEYHTVIARKGMIGKRGKEIGIHSIRGGTGAGEHSALYLGNDEKLEIKHTAISRQIFVNGAIKAAYWLLNQANGFYTLDQMIEENLHGC